MAQQEINVGASANDGQGNPIRTAFIKCNDNFDELYARAQTSPPPSLVGSIGDEPGYYAYDSTYFYYCFANYDGSSVIWAQITQIGNIALTQLVSGNSSVAIESVNGNAVFTIGGTANLAVFSNTGQYVTGEISATGNVTGNYILGDGSLLTGLPANYGNTNVASFLTTYTGNYAGNDISLTGNVTAAQINSNLIDAPSGTLTIDATANVLGLTTFNNDVTVQTDMSVVGTVRAGNLSATGNVIGTYFIGDGGFLSNINASVGSQIVNGLSKVQIPVNSGNVAVSTGFTPNVAVFSPNGVDVTGSLNTTLDVVATGEVIGGNIQSLGDITAVGNITGSYFIGNGSLLTGITGGSGTNYSNANVAAFLPTYTGNLSAGNISVSGNVDGNLNGIVSGQLNGLVNGVNLEYGTWDFGYIQGNTYTNPIQWIFAVTPAGNVDMGTVPSPSSLEIDIGTLF